MIRFIRNKILAAGTCWAFILTSLSPSPAWADLPSQQGQVEPPVATTPVSPQQPPSNPATPANNTPVPPADSLNGNQNPLNKPQTVSNSAFLPPPSAAKGGTDANILDWAAYSDTDGYKIYRREFGQTEENKWTELASVSSDRTRFIDTNPVQGKFFKDTPYQYKVIAYKGNKILQPPLDFSQTANYEVPTQGLQPENVLVLINDSPDGLGYVDVNAPVEGRDPLPESTFDRFLKDPRLSPYIRITRNKKEAALGLYYAAVRGIPNENIVVLKDIPTEERWEADMVTGVYTPGGKASWPYLLPETPGILDKTKFVLSVAQGGSWGDQYRLVRQGDDDLQKAYSLTGGGSAKLQLTQFFLEDGREVSAEEFVKLWENQWAAEGSRYQPFAHVESAAILHEGREIKAASKVQLYKKPLLDSQNFENKVINPIVQHMQDKGIVSKILSVVSAYHFPISLPDQNHQTLGHGFSWEGQLNKKLSEKFGAVRYRFDGGRHLLRISGDGGFITTRIDAGPDLIQGLRGQDIAKRLIDDSIWAEQHPVFNDPSLSRKAYVDWRMGQIDRVMDISVAAKAEPARGIFMVPGILDDTKWRLSAGDGDSLLAQYRLVTPGDNDLETAYSLAEGGSAKLQATVFQLEDGKQVGFQTFKKLWNDSKAAKKFFITVDVVKVVQDGREVLAAQKVTLTDGNPLPTDLSFLQAANKVGESGFFGNGWTPLDLSKINGQNGDAVRFGYRADGSVDKNSLFVLAPNIKNELNDIFFYTGWYGTSHNFSGLDRVTPFHMARGAVAYHLESFAGETMRTLKGNEYAAGFLSKGAAAVMGAVYEPSSSGTFQPAQLTYYLMQGYSFGEAVYYSDPVNTNSHPFNAINADPLYRPFPSSARPNPSSRLGVEKITDPSGGQQIAAGERHLLAENAWGQKTYLDFDAAGRLIREGFANGKTILHLKDGSTAVLQTPNQLHFNRSQLEKIDVHVGGDRSLSLTFYDPSGKKIYKKQVPFDYQTQLSFSYEPGTQKLTGVTYRDGTGTKRADFYPAPDGSLDAYFKLGEEEFVVTGIDAETPVDILLFSLASMPEYIQEMKNYRKALTNYISLRDGISKDAAERQIPLLGRASEIPGVFVYELIRNKPAASSGPRVVLKSARPSSVNPGAQETYAFETFKFDPEKHPNALRIFSGSSTVNPDGVILLFNTAGQLIYELKEDKSFKEYRYLSETAQTPSGYVLTSAAGTRQYYSAEGKLISSVENNQAVIYAGYPDKGVKTLQEAVTIAQSGDTIRLSAGTYTITESLKIGGKKLWISGDGQREVVLAQGSQGVVSNFAEITNGASVVFENITFRNFNMQGEHQLSMNGGAFRVANASLSLRNTVFENNSGDFGGAIHASEGAKLFVINSVFKGNKAAGGGAIFAISGSEVELVNTEFEGNQGGTGPYGGGAVYLRDSKLSIRNALFRGNAATTGAAVQLKGSSTANLENVTMTGNHAQAGNGAVNLENAGSGLNMRKGIIYGNEGEDISVKDSGAAANVTQSLLQKSRAGTGNKTGDPKLAANGTASSDSPARSANDPWSWGYNIPQGTITSVPTPNAPATPPTPIREDQLTRTDRPVDTTKPTRGTVDLKVGNIPGEVELGFFALDDLSGVAKVAGSWDNGKTWGQAIDYVSGQTYALQASWVAGKHVFLAKFWDGAGNVSDIATSNEIDYQPFPNDKTPPTGKIWITESPTPGKVILHFEAEDPSGVQQMFGSFDGKKWGNPPVDFISQYELTPDWPTEGNHVFRVKYIDRMGNVSKEIASDPFYYKPAPSMNEKPPVFSQTGQRPQPLSSTGTAPASGAATQPPQGGSQPPPAPQNPPAPAPAPKPPVSPTPPQTPPPPVSPALVVEVINQVNVFYQTFIPPQQNPNPASNPVLQQPVPSELREEMRGKMTVILDETERLRDEVLQGVPKQEREEREASLQVHKPDIDALRARIDNPRWAPILSAMLDDIKLILDLYQKMLADYRRLTKKEEEEEDNSSGIEPDATAKRLGVETVN